jgi:hypothetical protein
MFRRSRRHIQGVYQRVCIFWQANEDSTTSVPADVKTLVYSLKMTPWTSKHVGVKWKSVETVSSAFNWLQYSYSLKIFSRVRKITENDYYLSYVCRSVSTTRLPLGGFSWKLIFEEFSKLCQAKSSLIKIFQEEQALYVKTHVHLW